MERREQTLSSRVSFGYCIILTQTRCMGNLGFYSKCYRVFHFLNKYWIQLKNVFANHVSVQFENFVKESGDILLVKQLSWHSKSQTVIILQTILVSRYACGSPCPMLQKSVFY